MGDFFGEVGGVDGGGGVTDVVVSGGFLDVVGRAKVVSDTEGGEDGCWKNWTGGVWEAGVRLVSCYQWMRK